MTEGRLLLCVALVLAALCFLSAFGVIGTWTLATLIGLLAAAAACLIAASLAG
jgi:hypothetical protein